MILASEIQQPVYAGMSDDAISAALNAVGAATRRPVALAALLAEAVLNGAYAAVKASSESPDTPAEVRGVCASVLVLLSGVIQEVDLDDPRVANSMDVLEIAGVLTPAQVDEIGSLANVPGTARWQVLGLAAPVTVADIRAARDWISAQAAEVARQAAYDLLRERLINAPRNALSRLQVLQYDGVPAPQWSEVLAWL